MASKRADPWRLSAWARKPRWNGLVGLTTAVFSNPSGISSQAGQKQASIGLWED